MQTGNSDINNEDPLAYFITWTIYGTWLQGDLRGWRRYQGRDELPQPKLVAWRRDRLLHLILLLTDAHREVVANEIEQHCQLRGWKLWKVNPRTNHVHVVVTATEVNGSKVRDQLKANSTRGLRESDVFRGTTCLVTWWRLAMRQHRRRTDNRH